MEDNIRATITAMVNNILKEDSRYPNAIRGKMRASVLVWESTLTRLLFEVGYLHFPKYL